ncbi:MAG: TonB-dependent receptor [Sideroxyarcus sp.]
MNKNFVAMSAVSLMLSMSYFNAAQAADTLMAETTANTPAILAGEPSADSQPATPVDEPKVGIPERQKLKEVVVTATKTAMDKDVAPANVSVISSKDIEVHNVSRLGDALKQVPSLYLQNGALGSSQGTSGSSGMSLRGIDQKKTLIMIDGQPIQDGSSGAVNWRTVFVDDIERVEVVPGAFSSLYGSNAIGGVINVITKSPDKREFSLKLKKGWKDAAGTDASFMYRDKMANGLGVVVGYGYQDRDSYINEYVVRAPVPGAAGPAVSGAQSVTTNAGVPAYLVGDKGTAPWRQINWTTKLFYDLDGGDKLYGGVAYSEMNLGYSYFNTYLRNASGNPVYSGTVGVNGQRVTLTESLYLNSSPLFESNWRYFAGYEGTLSNGYKLKADLARINREYRFSTVGSTATWGSGPGSLTDSPNYGQDGTLQLSFPVGDSQFLVSGISLHRESVDRKVYNLTNWRDPASRTTANNGYTAQSTTVSLFVQDEISVSNKVTVYAGGRIDRWQTQGNYFQNTAPVSTLDYPSRSVSSFNPKLSAVYLPQEAITLRASYGQSFRAPNNLDLYSTTIISSGSSPTGYSTTRSDPNLKPERGTTWEAGGEWRVTQDFKVNATYYETVLKDLIYSKQIDLSLTQRINAGKAKIKGIELGAEIVLLDWLKSYVNYAYVNSRMLENPTDQQSVGKRLTSSPKNIANLGFSAQQGAWNGTLDARYVSHIFQNAQNTDTVEGMPGSYDSYTLVDAKLGYAISKFTKLNVSVNNIFNRKYYSFYLNPGRNMLAELTFSY